MAFSLGRSPAESLPKSLAKRLDRYELLVPIGRGGMATVYLAKMCGPRGFEREVAVKRMHAFFGDGTDGRAADLLREAELAALIRHPNVVSVLDVGEDEEGVHLVMPYIECASLAELLNALRALGERMAPAIVLRILADALAGLHAAHELSDGGGAPLGLVHRDFSPQNILVGIDGVTLLTDFGIAKIANRDNLTQEGFVKGKTGYMSPEQARGKPLDRRSDVWAAGVVAWEAHAQQRLYPLSGDAVATAIAICTERARPLRSVRPDVPAAVDEAIASALEPELDRRCATAEEFRRRLLAAWGMSPADAIHVAKLVARVAGEELGERRRRAEDALRASTTTQVSVALPSRPPGPTVRTSKRLVWASMGFAVAAAIAAAATVARLNRSPRQLSVEAPPSATVTQAVFPRDLAASPFSGEAPATSQVSTSTAGPAPTFVTAGSSVPSIMKRAPVARPASSDNPRVTRSLLGDNPYEPSQ